SSFIIYPRSSYPRFLPCMMPRPSEQDEGPGPRPISLSSNNAAFGLVRGASHRRRDSDAIGFVPWPEAEQVRRLEIPFALECQGAIVDRQEGGRLLVREGDRVALRRLR